MEQQRVYAIGVIAPIVVAAVYVSWRQTICFGCCSASSHIHRQVPVGAFVYLWYGNGTNGVRPAPTPSVS